MLIEFISLLQYDTNILQIKKNNRNFLTKTCHTSDDHPRNLHKVLNIYTVSSVFFSKMFTHILNFIIFVT